MNAERITDHTKLIAGILYCLFTREYDSERGEEYDCAGALPYWNGYEFTYEDGDTCNADWDFAIAQSDKPNPEYISGPQFVIDESGKEVDRNVWRERSIAQWRAECAERGVTV